MFQNFDPEKKKLISRYLRLCAHLYGAQLLFASDKSESLMNKTRNLLNNIAFQTTISLNPVFDYNKAIVIPTGTDSFEQIGYKSLDLIKDDFIAIFPQLITKLVIPDDPAQDPNFKERDIDLILSQKNNVIIKSF